jgi:tRNA modification GTPase
MSNFAVMMMQDNEIICAVSTPTGVGGIAVIRVSGPGAMQLVDKVWRGKRLSEAESHTAHLGNIVDEAGKTLDQAVATVFRGPASFTGEDVVELSVHGSTWIQRETVNLLVRNGARMATAGEFTRRAFASGKLDLAEAEAIADVIASSSRAAHRIAISQMKGEFSKRLDYLRDRLLELSSLLELELDFSEEDVEFASRKALLSISEEIHGVVKRLADSFATGAAIKSGVPVAIVGAANAGKSTLLNRLLGDERAIVSDIPGTTRDTIEDTLEINGILFRIIDTAGLRDTADVIENIGISRTISQIEKAAIILWVVDSSADAVETSDAWKRICEFAKNDDRHLIVAANKHDIALKCDLPEDAVSVAEATVSISASTGDGVDELKNALVNASGVNEWGNDIVVSNARHYQALIQAGQSVRRVIDGLNSGLSGDFIAMDLRDTLHHIGTITGKITTDEILANVFSRFCIGK